MGFWPRSLFGRILAGTALWTALGLVVSALVLAETFRANAETRFRSLLEAHGYNVMGALERDRAGRLRGMPDLRDPRFLMPLSGWTWAAFDKRDRIASPSLASARLSLAEIPFDDTFTRSGRVTDPGGKDVLVMETQLLVDQGDDPVTIQVAGPLEVVEEQVAAFRRNLFAFFGLFGLGLVLLTAGVLRVGLRPLARVRLQLAEIRDGEREMLEGEQPREVQPLAEEVNALLRTNREVIERARRQVGNLAHGLKTPLTVLRNEAEAQTRVPADTVREQVDAMREQVDAYLDRARIAAVRRTARARTPVAPVADSLVRTVAKLAPNIDVALAKPVDPSLEFAGEKGDLEEMLGNLIENASRFARSQVRVDVERQDRDLLFLVDDDGDGLDDAQMKRALSRGVRLDERRSGSGLGLSIVVETAEAYGGAFTLERSGLGGLRAVLRLPYALRRR